MSVGTDRFDSLPNQPSGVAFNQKEGKAMKHILAFSLTISLFAALSCGKQDKAAETPSSPPTPPHSSPSAGNAQFDVVKASYKNDLSIKTIIRDKSGKEIREDKINVGNISTGFPFVIFELVLKVDELKLIASAARLIDPTGKEYPLDGTAAFSVENYHPLPPSKGTIFDLYPLTETDGSGSTVALDWKKGTQEIEIRASGKGAKLILIYAAPKIDGEYKLVVPDSEPISIRPESN